MAGQGFADLVAAVTPNDYSITVRGIRFVPGEFSDMEVGPLSTLGTRLETGDWATGMAGMMEELYRSLRTIYGEAITPFYNRETGRLLLHSPELLLLANAAMNKLAADPHYRAGKEQAEKASAKLTSGADFAGAVAAKLGPNPEEVALAAQIKADNQARLDALQAELAQLRAEEGI